MKNLSLKARLLLAALPAVLVASLGVGLVARLAPSAADHPMTMTGLAVAALLAGLLVLARTVERVVVRPLVTLRESIHLLRAGHPMELELPTGRTDEVGQLAFEVLMLAAELRTSEHGRNRSEAKNRALLNAIPDMMFLMDREGTFVDFKPSNTLDTLVPPSVFLGKNVKQFFPRHIAERTLELVARAIEQDAVQLLEYELPDEDGMRSYEARFVACDENEVLTIVREITERKQAERARARLATILDATPDLVATADLNGAILYLNAAGQKMIGVDVAGPSHNLWKGHFVPDWASRLLLDEAVPEANRRGVWSGESAFRRPDGTEIPVSQVVLAHRAPDGSVEYYSTIARDISGRKSLEAKLTYLADHDPLTHLLGRRRFQEELGRELARAARTGATGALLYLDLDEFKYVNDSLGHNAGDELLVSIAKLLRLRLRKSDVVARLGGDEFAILLLDTDRTEAQQVAGQILEAIRHHAITVDGHPLGTTASIGIAVYPEQGKTAEELAARADLAMYQAKLRGRNGVVVYTPDRDWQAQVASRLSGEKRIREALEEGRFVLHAQPIVDIRTRRVVRYELLVRMLDERDRIVLPGAFIRIAERFGLIHALETWVVSRAIEVLGEQDRAGKDLRFSVNLSGKSFSSAELVQHIRRELDRARVDPSRLTFELTETAAIADTTEALNFATALKSLGCRLALDDFGIGFSSLHHLKHLPVDDLKIDGSFVRNLPTSRVDERLVKTIVEVSRALEKSTVAEFVGDEETLAILERCGVDYAQGYHVGRPAPLETVLAAVEAASAPPPTRTLRRL